MSDHDDATLRFYADEAAAYASRPREPSDAWLSRFLAALPPGGSVLELGCGGGQDSEAMLARGFDVTPTDGVPEIAREAEKRLGRTVRVLRFGDLDETERYDGVWANACLLHVPREELPEVIGRIRAALKPGGVFGASYKSGSQEGRDGFGRYYNYPSSEWLRSAYRQGRWRSVAMTSSEGSGYDGRPTDWLHVMAVKG
jgi:SAM-dependent methyltransferase